MCFTEIKKRHEALDRVYDDASIGRGYSIDLRGENLSHCDRGELIMMVEHLQAQVETVRSAAVLAKTVGNGNIHADTLLKALGECDVT